MVPLFDIPFLERTLGRLRTAGVQEVILAAGYLPAAIENHFGDGSRIGMKVTYVVEDHPLGTAGALKNLEDRITGTFFVLNGDVLTSLDLAAMIAYHKKQGGVGVLHAIKVDDPSAFGCIVRDTNDRIDRFVEKPPREDAPTDEINAGTYLLERSVLGAIPAGRNVSIERETFPTLLASGDHLYSYVTKDYWLDVGRPHQYLQAHVDVLDRKLDLADGAGTETGAFYFTPGADVPTNIQTPTFVGKNATIDPTASVGPYAVIGSGSTIGKGANVRDSVLWDGVVVGAGAQISDSILASNVRVGEGARVTLGAVVGHDASIAAHAILEPDARVAKT
jgi:mannose-1-phosphate guanylyltransferase